MVHSKCVKIMVYTIKYHKIDKYTHRQSHTISQLCTHYDPCSTIETLPQQSNNIYDSHCQIYEAFVFLVMRQFCRWPIHVGGCTQPHNMCLASAKFSTIRSVVQQNGERVIMWQLKVFHFLFFSSMLDRCFEVVSDDTSIWKWGARIVAHNMNPVLHFCALIEFQYSYVNVVYHMALNISNYFHSRTETLFDKQGKRTAV